MSSCRTRRTRLAPIEARTASSCCRAIPRASSRIETLAHPITKSAITATNRSTNVPEKWPSTSSLSVTIATFRSRRKSLGSSFTKRLTRTCNSAAAAGCFAPGFSLMKDIQ